MIYTKEMIFDIIYKKLIPPIYTSDYLYFLKDAKCYDGEFKSWRHLKLYLIANGFAVSNFDSRHIRVYFGKKFLE